MRIAILGLQGAGKKTLFKLLTGGVAASIDPKGLPGVCRVQDSRVTELSRVFNPKKTTYAQLDILLMPDVEKTEGKAKWLEEMRIMDGLVFVVRSFDDPSVFHPQGLVDPKRDIDAFLSELIFADIAFLEKRKENIDSELRVKRTPDKEKELELVQKLSAGLEAGVMVRDASLSDTEQRILASYNFLSARTVIVAVNNSHGADDPLLRDWVASTYSGRLVMAAFDAKLEDEISGFTDTAERKEFMDGLGIAEPAIAKLTNVVYSALGLISYFTVGEDEVRAWTVRKDSSAPQAARAIHSDLERGFVRVEVMAYKDIIEFGGEEPARTAGRWWLKGKDYIVQDGDVLCFRCAT
ncbi:DUF933 domain-containing protein [Elusimicrobiota bacterium]